MIRSGGCSVIARSAASPLDDDLHLGFAAALERVLDQAGDVVLVLDDQDPWRPVHRGSCLLRHPRRGGVMRCGIHVVLLTVARERFAVMTARLIVGYARTADRPG